MEMLESGVELIASAVERTEGRPGRGWNIKLNEPRWLDFATFYSTLSSRFVAGYYTRTGPGGNTGSEGLFFIVKINASCDDSATCHARYQKRVEVGDRELCLLERVQGRIYHPLLASEWKHRFGNLQ